MKNQGCKFCRLAAGERPLGVVDQPFMESENFLAIPSLGSFIEGWTLIIPRRHVLSLSKFYSDEEFLDFSKSVAERVESLFGKIIFFEHGPSEHNSLTGCGIDHAHLHLVPLDGSLAEVMRRDLEIAWTPSDGKELAERTASQDYLFYSESGPRAAFSGLVGRARQPVSQYFRRKLAEVTQQPEDFDYKLTPLIEQSVKSGHALSGSSR